MLARMLGEERASWCARAEDERGAVKMWLVPPDCVVLDVRGHMNVHLAMELRRMFDDCLIRTPAPKLHGFCDYFEVTGVDAAARAIIQELVKVRRDRLARLHYGVKSTFVVVGVQIAALFHKVASYTYSSPARLEAAMREHLAG